MGPPFSPPPEERLEAAMNLQAGSIRGRAGFRTHDPDVIAGGPIEVEAFVENTGASPCYVAAGTDRSRLRPAFFSFTAVLESSDIVLDDPQAHVPDLGGPANIIHVKPGASYSQSLLVNEFVRLEKVTTILKPGEKRRLYVRCQRPLPLAHTEQQAFQMRTDVPSIDVTLVVGVRRDDAALESLVVRLGEAVRAERSAAVTPEAIQAISQLVALRVPMMLPYLEMLADHPDPEISIRVQRALASLK